MHWGKIPTVALGLSLATACVSSAAPRTSGDAVPDGREAGALTAEEGLEPTVPERCIERKNACMPPIQWATDLCEDVYEDLALYMFREGTPWTRFYVRSGINAVNGWGATLHEDMVSQEEVIVINHRLTRNSLQLEGSDGTYDVLRWNGSCVTLDVNQVTAKAPATPRNSTIEWLALSEDMRTKLLENEKVASSLELRRKACKGASVGRASDQCAAIHQAFMRSVANAVRQTQDLPAPGSAPSLRIAAK